MKRTDTIAAIATALGESGIGIIRISGEDAVSIADKIYSGKKRLIEADSHTINYGHIFFDEEIIDEVLVMIMKAPRTFTGEDTVDLTADLIFLWYYDIAECLKCTCIAVSGKSRKGIYRFVCSIKRSGIRHLCSECNIIR